MSTYMVQENHQEKLKQKLFEYAIPLYFFWVILDHPVGPFSVLLPYFLMGQLREAFHEKYVA